MLYTHLQALIDKPENQKKFADIERKLQMRGALPATKKPPDSSLGSEVSRESDSGSNEERCVANLYDSLAAELKQKLSTGKKGLGQSIFINLCSLVAYTAHAACTLYAGFICVFMGMYCGNMNLVISLSKISEILNFNLSPKHNVSSCHQVSLVLTKANLFLN